MVDKNFLRFRAVLKFATGSKSLFYQRIADAPRQSLKRIRWTNLIRKYAEGAIRIIEEAVEKQIKVVGETMEQKLEIIRNGREAEIDCYRRCPARSNWTVCKRVQNLK
uniref:Uncharacterized protein n=1 Tax=Grammatophora oceanica TaxID=210454 RepID=A0A7S1YDJ4_9STRA|mmetsp:Transcript_41017/g.60761  ORF Transcript_41017/g.60761 Transcript_41017/m.60761 type:complete len:108 (+) Transcript_41017:68-391(+)